MSTKIDFNWFFTTSFYLIFSWLQFGPRLNFGKVTLLTFKFVLSPLTEWLNVPETFHIFI